MLYRLLKLPARIAFYFYCRRLFINNKDFLRSDGPLLIAANHPSSFLDAVILATLFKNPVHSLARGDVFANSFYKKILHSLNMLPVYRISEGAHNLEHNYKTFAACLDIFRKNGIVLMFSEGGCLNEWRLRPLKKGTARLAITAWQENIPLKVIPLGINYSSFRTFGKNIILNAGEPIRSKSVYADGRSIAAFNDELNAKLEKLVIQLDKTEREKRKELFHCRVSLIKQILLFFPAALGYVIHAPLYYAAVLSIRNRANDHYDSVMVGLFFIFYPLYLLLIAGIVYSFSVSMYAWLLVLLIPFTAWAALQLKRIY